MILTVRGLPEAEAQLQRIIRGSKALASASAEVGSRLPYAYGIEYGFKRKSGKLARRAGGALYLNRAFLDVLTDANRDLGEGLKLVTAPGPWVITRLAKWVRRLAKSYAPVGEETYDHHPGKLRKSIVIVRGARL